jgi:hypothetical protein
MEPQTLGPVYPPNQPRKILLLKELKFINCGMARPVALSEYGCSRTFLDNHVALAGPETCHQTICLTKLHRLLQLRYLSRLG